jgi:predicted ATP-binding protein involved in virulence
MRSFDSEQYIKKARRAWFFGLLGICMVYLLTSSNATSLGAMLQFPFRMIFAVIFSHLAAKYIAPFQLSIHQTMIEKAAHAKESLQQEQAQEALQKEIDSLNKESRNQQDASKTSQSKRELVMRLGSVDQFILKKA